MKRNTCIALIAAVCFHYAPCAIAITPFAGHWWNPNESGTGYNLDVFNDVLVVTIYSYKSPADSEWYLAAGPMNSDGHQFIGTLDKYRNGQCISCPYHSPNLIGNDGTIAIDFHSTTSATVTLPSGRVTNIEPFFPTTTDSLQGTYRLKRATVNYLNSSLLDTDAGNVVASGTMVINGSDISQTVSVYANGVTSTISWVGTFVDYGSFIIVTQTGAVPTRLPLVIRHGPLLATESIFSASGAIPTSSEVDQWELVSRSVIVEKDTSNADSGFTVNATVGNALTQATRTDQQRRH